MQSEVGPDLGQFILAQVRAKPCGQAEPNTLFTPDGSPFRVWLAYDDRGNPKIGDALDWGINCGHLKAEQPEPVPAPSPPPPQHTGPALQSDYPLEYYEDGYPKLPACLDRRSNSA